MFVSFQKGTGRGPGRPRKKRPVEENVTIAADTPPAIPSNNSSLSFTGADDSILSIDSACPSPQSAVSICSLYGLFPPANELRESNVFTGVCFFSQDGVGYLWSHVLSGVGGYLWYLVSSGGWVLTTPPIHGILQMCNVRNCTTNFVALQKGFRDKCVAC